MPNTNETNPPVIPAWTPPWTAALNGKRVVVQEKAAVVAHGTLQGFESGYLHLTEATVKGRAKTASPPDLWIHLSSVAHIHEEVEAAKVAQEASA